jgi:hypothetical protein
VNSSSTAPDATFHAANAREDAHAGKSAGAAARSAADRHAMSRRAVPSSAPKASAKRVSSAVFFSPAQGGGFVATFPEFPPPNKLRSTVVFPEPLGPWMTPRRHFFGRRSAGKSGGVKELTPSNAKSNARDADSTAPSTRTRAEHGAGNAPSPSTTSAMAPSANS